MTQFELVIKAYLDKRANEDEQFAQSYAKEKKSIEECCRYIIGEASKQQDGNTAVMSDEEVYGLAVHYYDEDDIKVEPVHGGVSATQAFNGATYEPTEADKEAARKSALRRLEEEAYQKLHTPKRRKAEAEPVVQTQTTLFD